MKQFEYPSIAEQIRITDIVLSKLKLRKKLTDWESRFFKSMTITRSAGNVPTNAQYVKIVELKEKYSIRL